MYKMEEIKITKIVIFLKLTIDLCMNLSLKIIDLNFYLNLKNPCAIEPSPSFQTEKNAAFKVQIRKHKSVFNLKSMFYQKIML